MREKEISKDLTPTARSQGRAPAPVSESWQGILFEILFSGEKKLYQKPISSDKELNMVQFHFRP